VLHDPTARPKAPGASLRPIIGGIAMGIDIRDTSRRWMRDRLHGPSIALAKSRLA
jgi:hypothetical protein